MRGKRGKILKNFPSLPPRPHLSFQNFLIFKGRMTGERKGKRGKNRREALERALRPQRPVCTGYAVRPAELVRRALRLTAEVNPACLPAVGATVQRQVAGPRALKNEFGFTCGTDLGVSSKKSDRLPISPVMRALREYFSGCICRSAFGIPSPSTSGNPIL